MKHEKQSFTLIEILVVIVIIGILSSFIFFTINNSVDKANVAKTQMFSESLKNNLLLNLVNDWNAESYTKNEATWTLLDLWGSNNGSFRSSPGSSTCSDVSGSEACPQIQTDSDIGDVLVFSGADGERISIDGSWAANFESIHGPTTAEVWFNQSESQTYSIIIGDNCIEWGVIVQNQELWARIYTSYSLGNIDLNKWYHVVLIHDHSIDDPATIDIKETAVKIYLDGEKKIDSVVNITTHNGYLDYPLQIGDDNCTAGREFIGKVKQVRLYNEALSGAQVKQNYLSGLNNLYAKRLIID